MSTGLAKGPRHTNGKNTSYTSTALSFPSAQAKKGSCHPVLRKASAEYERRPVAVEENPPVPLVLVPAVVIAIASCQLHDESRRSEVSIDFSV